jgi:hypothetical protein
MVSVRCHPGVRDSDEVYINGALNSLMKFIEAEDPISGALEKVGRDTEVARSKGDVGRLVKQIRGSDADSEIMFALSNLRFSCIESSREAVRGELRFSRYEKSKAGGFRAVKTGEGEEVINSGAGNFSTGIGAADRLSESVASIAQLPELGSCHPSGFASEV